ncbi:hypothetical protein [Maridesulfovibrio sp.]|uniref:hypothetical protein n=1 Tax=Maridesulfovibrio sp. TaxID=2795000 RepID=UPI003B00DFFF
MNSILTISADHLDEIFTHNVIEKLSEAVGYLDSLPDTEVSTSVCELSEELYRLAKAAHKEFLSRTAILVEQGNIEIPRCAIISHTLNLTRPFILLAEVNGDEAISETINSLLGNLHIELVDAFNTRSRHA